MLSKGFGGAGRSSSSTSLSGAFGSAGVELLSVDVVVVVAVLVVDSVWVVTVDSTVLVDLTPGSLVVGLSVITVVDAVPEPVVEELTVCVDPVASGTAVPDVFVTVLD